MSISDAEYSAWLKADGKARVLLVEATAYSGGAAVTRYMSNRAFVSGPTATPANIAYDDIIVGAPEYHVSMPEQFTGNIAGTWGAITIDNSAGVRDSWLNDAWDGRSIKLLIGDPSWSRDDFRTVMVGVIDDIIAPSRTQLALRLQDKTGSTRVAIQKSLIGGTTANKNAVKPLAFGECFNIEPPLVTAATHEYQPHDGAINDEPDVRDGGLTVGYTKDLANGKFTLTAAPAGVITCNVQGAKPSGTYYTKTADIINHIVTTRTTLTSGDIDTAAFTAFNTTCPQKVGIYIKDRRNVDTVLDELMRGVGGFWTFDRAGLLTIGRLEAPSGTPVLELDADDIRENGITLMRRILPVDTYRMGYATNYTPQAEGLFGAVTEANRALYGADEQIVTASNAGITTTYLLARNPDVESTTLQDATEAQTECTRRATLWGTLRKIFKVGCYASPFTLRIGHVIKITHPRFGFSGGVLGVVVGIHERPVAAQIDLEVFV